MTARGENPQDRRAAETLARLRQSRAERELRKSSTSDAVDAFFDRELRPDSARALFDALRADPLAREEFDATQRALDDLRRPVAAPDLSSSILSTVGRRRPWLPGRLRRVVVAGRYAAAACFLGLLSAAFVAERYNPEVFNVTNEPAPVAELITETGQEARQGFEQIQASVASLKPVAERPAPRPMAIDFSADGAYSCGTNRSTISCTVIKGRQIQFAVIMHDRSLSPREKCNETLANIREARLLRVAAPEGPVLLPATAPPQPPQPKAPPILEGGCN
ncbi:MAG: hypothetical protein VYC34_01080 [Planctomycetota bacterium]|nr:hypothetical protein [Planctomycetota bacterium]